MTRQSLDSHAATPRMHAFLAYDEYRTGMKARRIGIHFLIKATTVAAAALAMAGAAQAGPTVDAIKKRGELVCGVSQGSAGLSIADAQGRWTGLTPTCAARWPPPCWATRPRPASCRSVRSNAFRAAKRRDRRAEPQHHHHLGPRRRPGHRLGRHRVLRRPGLHGAEEAGRQERRRTGRRAGLRAAGHRQRTEPGRLLQEAQAVVPAGGDREPGGAGTGLLRGPLRCLPVGRVHAGRQPRRPRRQSG